MLLLAALIALAVGAGAQDASVPDKPTGLTVDSITTAGVAISWDDPADATITGYEILRRDRDADALGVFHTLVADSGSNATSYTDASVSAGGSYVYRVKALNPAGASARSSFVRADVPADLVITPQTETIEPDTVEPDTVEPENVPPPDPKDQDPLEDQPRDDQLVIVTDDDPVGARQEAVSTLVSNTEQTSSDDLSLNSTTTRGAQGFETGSNATGYTLSSISYEAGGHSLVGDTYTGHLYTADTSGGFDVPDTAICELTPSGTFGSNQLNKFSVPESCATLAADTTYFFVLIRVSGTFNWDTTTSFGEDSGGAGGWSINDELIRYTSSWGQNPAGRLQIKVEGSINPLPEVLVSNRGQATAGRHALSDTVPARAQAFVTGTNTTGYSLSAISMDSQAAFTTGVTLSAALHLTEQRGSNADDFQPAAKVCDLTVPATLVSSGENIFTAPDACGTLAANTRYIFVLTRDASSTSNFTWVRTSTDEDSGGADGWTIEDEYIRFESDSWTEVEGGSLKIEVKGFIIPSSNSPATGKPTITGTPPTVGNHSTADTSSIADADGFDDDALEYQWIRVDSSDNDTDIVGATAKQYYPTADDVSNKLKVRVSFTDNQGNEESLTSDATSSGVVGSSMVKVIWWATMVVGQHPSIGLGYFGGDHGSSLTDATFSHDSTDYTLQSLYGQGTRTYIVTDPDDWATASGADDRDTWEMNVKGTKMAFNVMQDLSGGPYWNIQVGLRVGEHVALALMVSNVAATGKPTISGTEQVPRTLTADISGVNDQNGIPETGISYQWIRGSDDISGATASTYKLVAADVGETIKVKVSFTDRDGFSETATSDATGMIAARATNTAATGVPTIAGVAQVGSALAADPTSISDANGTDDVIYRYQWISIDSSNTETEVSGATARRYYPTDDDVGKTFKVKVSFADNDDYEEMRTSAASGAVAASSSTTVLWTGTLVVTADTRTTRTGFSSGVFGSLPGNTFTHDSQTWSIFGLYLNMSRLTIWLDPARPSAGDLATWVMGVRGVDFVFSNLNLNPSEGSGLHYWDAPGVTWNVGEHVALAVMADNSAATGKPTITGMPNVGQTLTADVSAIADKNGKPDADDFSYQWVRVDGSDTTNVGTDSTYELVLADKDKTIKVVVSFTDKDGFSESVESDETSAIAAAVNQAATGTLAISGTAQIGEMLSSSLSDLADGNGFANASFSYQWLRVDGGDVEITGATAPNYYPGEDDIGHQLKVQVSFTDDGGNFETLTSDATASAVADSTSTNVMWSATMTIGLGGFSNTEGYSTTPSYGSISSSRFSHDSSNHTVTAIYWGLQTLTVTTFSAISATDVSTWVFGLEGDDWALSGSSYQSDHPDKFDWTASFVDLEASSDNNVVYRWRVGDQVAVAMMVDNSSAEGQPTISGSHAVGEDLTASIDNIADHNGLPGTSAFNYQWVRTDSGTDRNISGETSSTYTLTSDDVGKTIKVKVSFNDKDGFAEEVVSEPTRTIVAMITPNSAATGAPAITGTPQIGEALTATAGTIADTNGLVNVSYSYQWIRVSGGTDSDIAGATANKYYPTAADVGKTIKVKLTFEDDDGYTENLTSAATGTVATSTQTMVIWWATLTAATDATLGTGFDATLATSSLDNDNTNGATFTDPGATSVNLEDVTVTALRTDGSKLYFAAGPLGWRTNSRVVATWVLGADGTDYAVNAAADRFLNDRPVSWSSPPSWTVGGKYAVALMVDNAPNTGTVSISGTEMIDNTLTASRSDSADANGLDDASYSWQWVRVAGDGETDISGANSSTYTLVQADVGSKIKVKTLYTDDDGFPNEVVSSETGVVAGAANNEATGAPTITGTAKIGEMLTADTSDIVDDDGLDDVSYTYQWQHVSGDNAVADITGAIAKNYYPKQSDVNAKLQVKVFFDDDLGNPETLTSEATDTVEDSDETKVFWWATMEVGVGGSPSQVGVWPGVIGSFTNDSAMARTIRHDSTDIEFTYLQYRNLDGTPLAINLHPDFDNTVADDMDDLATWVLGIDGTNYRFNSLTIPATPGAIPSWSTRPTWSEGQLVALALMVDNAAAQGDPVISGEAAVGQILSVDHTNVFDQNGLPPTNDGYSYQWIRVDSGAGAETEISGADAATYQLVDADAGKTIKVKVSFTDRDGFDEFVTSDESLEVAATQVLISNTAGVPSRALSAGTPKRAQSFLTGPNIDGYTLSTISFHMGSGTTTGVMLTATLHESEDRGSGSGDFQPKSDVLCTLTSPASYTASAENTFAVPASCPKLEANTRYFFVIERDSSSADSSWRSASSTGENDGAPGWTIDDDRHHYDGTDWQETSADALTLKVSGSILPSSNTPATGAPVILGTAKIGEALTADVSLIEDADGLINATFAYQWYRVEGGTDVMLNGQTAPNYYPDADDVGHTLKVVVTFEDDRTFEEMETSPETAEVTDSDSIRLLQRGVVTVGTGVGEDPGYSLNSNLGSIFFLPFVHTPNSVQVRALTQGATTLYMEFRDAMPDDDIATWVLGVDGVDWRFSVADASESKQGFTWSSTDTTWNEGDKIAIALMADNSTATGKPTIDGTVQVGQTLTADTTGIVDQNRKPATFSYQWVRVDGMNTTDIGTDSETYDLVADDEGKKIKLIVSFTDFDNFPESVESDETVAVAAAAVVDATVTIAPTTTPVTEGTAAAFTLTRTGATTAALTVSVMVTQEGAVITTPSDYASAVDVTFAVGSSTATLSVPTNDDSTREALPDQLPEIEGVGYVQADDVIAGRVTAVVQSGTGYAPGSGAAGEADAGSAVVDVNDDESRSTIRLCHGQTELTDSACLTATVTEVGGEFELYLYAGNTRPFGDDPAAATTVARAVAAVTVSEGAIDYQECVRPGGGACTSSSGHIHVLKVTPDADHYADPNVEDSRLILSLAADVHSGGNRPVTRAYNVVTPLTVTIEIANVVHNGNFTAKFTFSQDVETVGNSIETVQGWLFHQGGNVSDDDIKVTDGARVPFNVSGNRNLPENTRKNVWNVTVVPNGGFEGEVTISIGSEEVRSTSDGVGNSPAMATARIDTKKPTVTITGPMKAPRETEFEVTFKFSEMVTGFAEDDISVDQGTLVAGSLGEDSDPATDHTYVALFKSVAAPTDDKMTVTVAGAAAEDVGTNTNSETDLEIPVNQRPEFPAATATRSVDENSAGGVNVGAVVTATDGESDTLSYALANPPGSMDADAFEIDASTGQITTKTGVIYDHESKSSYTVIVQASDGNGTPGVVTVTIGIDDVDEPPSAPAAPTVEATSGVSTSLDVSWTAPDNAGKPDISDYDLQYRESGEMSWSSASHTGTGTSATITSLEEGTVYEVQVRANNAEGMSDWSESGSARTNAPPNSVATGGPSITGTAKVGELLTGDASSITDGDGLSGATFTYQWIRVDSGDSSESEISGATATKYYPTGDDVGHTLKLRVSFVDEHGNNETPTSDATATVADSETTKVIWWATMTVGEHGTPPSAGYLVSTTGSLSSRRFSHDSNDYSIGWITQDSNGLEFTMGEVLSQDDIDTWVLGVDGDDWALSASSYTLGDTLPFTWSSAGYSWSVGDLVALALMVDNSAATGAPTISGTATVGQTLTAATTGIADKNGLPDSFSYQWVRVDGEDETEIGTDSATYQLIAADAGKTIKVRVSFTDRDGFSEMVESVETDAVVGFGLVLSETSLTIVEGDIPPAGEQGYEVTLTSAPTADVTVTITAPNQVTVFNPANEGGQSVTLTFTTSNWNTAQFVDVFSVSDENTVNEVVDAEITHAATSTDTNYELTSSELGTVSVTVTDDDPVYSISGPETATEGDTIQFTVTRTGYTGEARTATADFAETGGCSYRGSSGEVFHFSVGDTTATVDLTLTDDDKVICAGGVVTATLRAHRNEAHYWELANDPEAVTVTVADNDSEDDIEWEMTFDPDEITEGDAGATLTVAITNGYTYAVDKTINIYRFTGESTGWSDLSGLSRFELSVDGVELAEDARVLTLEAGEASTEATLSLPDNDFYETTETLAFAASFSSASTLMPDAPLLATGELTLHDDDPQPTFTVTASAMEVTEGDSFKLFVTLDPPGLSPTGVRVTMSDPSGVVTTNFGTDGVSTVAFVAAQARKTLTFATDDDMLFESNGHVTFTLSPAPVEDVPVNVTTIGEPSSVTVVVLDNDEPAGVQTMASNLDSTTVSGDAFVTAAALRAQPFSTGTNTAGYALDSVGLSLGTIDTGETPLLSARITEAVADPDNAGLFLPGDVVCALTPPATITASAVNTWTAPTSGCFLQAGATYMALFKMENTSNISIAFPTTTEVVTDEDTGWSILKGHRFRAQTDGPQWSLRGNNALKLQLTGRALRGLTVAPDTLSLDEGSAGSYEVALTAPPSDTVTVTPTAGPGVTVSPSALTFNAANWNQSQTVLVVAERDDNTTNETVGITHATSGPAQYTGLVGLPGVTVSVTDLGTLTPDSMVLVSNTGQTNEGNGTVNRLNRQRAQAFTTGTESAGYVLTTVGIQLGSRSTGDPALTLTLHQDSSGEPGTAICTLTAPDEITANSLNSFTVPAACGTLTASTQYWLLLDITNTGHTRWKITTNDDDENPATGWSITDGSLKRAGTSGGWTSESGISNKIRISGHVAGTAGTAGVTVSPTALNLGEGSSGSYSVVLGGRPSANVTITPTAGTSLTVTPTSVEFTPTDWNSPKVFTVTASDDDAADGTAEITHTLNSTDTDYSSLTVDSVTVTIADDDIAGLTLSATELAIEEGATGSYTVALSVVPTSDVTITVTAPTGLTVSKTGDVADAAASVELTFSTTNWSTAQTVTVHPADDDDGDDPPQVSITHSVKSGSADEYLDVSSSLPAVNVIVADDDEPGVTLSVETLEINEGQSGSFTIQLDTRPEGPVAVLVHAAGESLGVGTSLSDVDQATKELQFAPADWNTPQTVYLFAVEDDDAENVITTINIQLPQGSVSGYGEIPDEDLPSIEVTIDDDETASVTVDPTSLTIIEGRSMSYDVNLGVVPTDDVTLTVTAPSGLMVSAGGSKAASVALTFTTSNWDNAQTVTVHVDEDDNTASETLSVTHSASSNDTAYDGLTSTDLAGVSVTTTDNDLGVCDRTAEVQAAILQALPSRTACADVTDSDLASIATLELISSGSYGLKLGDFSGLTTLTTLETGSNAAVASLPLGVLDPLTELTTLDLTREYVPTNPGEDAGGLSSLHVDNFDRLTKLTSLNLLGNSKLTELPSGIFDHNTALTNLHLGGLSLRSLPNRVFHKLTALTTLNLEGYGGEDELPMGVTVELRGNVFEQNRSLTTLNLTVTMTAELPPNLFQHQTDLVTLHLINNDLWTTLPEGLFRNLSSLTQLSLWGNDNLATLPGSVFKGLESLETLFLSDNALISLSDGLFEGMTALVKLQMQGNPTDPLPMNVDIVPGETNTTASGTFKIVVPAGATFDMTIPFTVTGPGTVTGGKTSVTLSTGDTESEALTITRDAGTTAAVKVSLGTLPAIPTTIGSQHLGYVLKDASGDPAVPREVLGMHIVPAILLVDSTDAEVAVTTLTVPEGGSATYDVKLSTEPTADVTVTITAGASSDDLTVSVGGGAPAESVTLTFTDSTWDTVQTVTLHAAEDEGSADETVTVAHSAASTDSDYSITASDGPDLTVTVNDNEVALCDRSDVVKEAVVAALGADDCMDVTDAEIMGLNSLWLEKSGHHNLQSGDFGGMTSLETLTTQSPNPIDNNFACVISMPAGVLDPLVELTTLDLSVGSDASSCNGMSSLPAGIFDKLTKLTSLSLNDNKALASLPAGVFDQLSELTNLQLGDLKLRSLPEGVFDYLSKLTTLYLEYYGGRDTLPMGVTVELDEDVFSSLTMLEDLNLSNTKLSALPSALFDGLAALEVLDLRTNALVTTLPGDLLGGLTALDELYINNNALSELPEGIFAGLTALSDLDTQMNTVNPLPLIVDVVVGETNSAASGTFKIVIPAGAPFAITIPFTVSTAGTITGAHTSVTIAQGDTASSEFTVTRNSSTIAPITVNLGELPSLPSGHTGYAPTKADGVPRVVVPAPGIVLVDSDDDEIEITELTVVEGETATYDVKLKTQPSDDVLVQAFATSGLKLSKATAPIPGLIAPLTFTSSNWNTPQRLIVHGDEDDNTTDRTLSITHLATSTNDPHYSIATTDLPALSVMVDDDDPTLCERSDIVQAGVLAALSETDCANVDDTGIAGLTSLTLPTAGSHAIEEDDFFGMSALTTLQTGSTTGITALLAGVLDPLTSLETLELDNNDSGANSGLSSLPASIFDRLTSLTTLNLGDNSRTTSLPDNVFDNNTALTELDLGGMKLESLPSMAFDQLAALEQLDLEGYGGDAASVTLDAGTFASLTMLTTLNLSSTKVSALPETIFSGLTLLEELDLSDNDLWTTVPADVFDGLSALTTLNLDNNDLLATLPAGLFDGLSALETLTLNDNALTDLPDGIFEGLDSLTTLDLSNNASAITLELDVTPGAANTAASGTFTVTVVQGAPFAMTVPFTVSGPGTVSGSATDANVALGDIHSSAVTITRDTGTTDAVEVDLGTLPSLPATGHSGYSLVKSSDLPRDVLSEAAGITLSASTLTVAEGGTATYEIKLASAPTASVTLTITAPDGLKVSTGGSAAAATATLTFSTSNWSTNQTVTVSAEEDDDAVNEMLTLSHSTTSTDTEFVLAASDLAGVSVTVTDNDTAGVSATKDGSAITTLTVDEGDNTTFQIKPLTEPSMLIEIVVTASDGAELGLTASPTAAQVSANFDATDWETAVTVFVVGSQDDDAEDESVTLKFSVNSPDGAAEYLALMATDFPSITVTVDDDDTRGVSVTDSSNNAITTLTVGEGSTGTYRLALDTEPTADVTVTATAPTGMTVSKTGNASDAAASVDLTFSASTWNTAQSVYVHAAEDANTVNETGNVTHAIDTSGATRDEGYDGVTIGSVAVTVTDNDMPGVTASKTTLSLNEGDTGTYTVVLNTEPSSNVDITVTAPEGAQVSKTGNASDAAMSVDLEFSTTNWNTAQTVHVHASEDDDAVDESLTIAHAVKSGSASEYRNISSSDLPGVAVTVDDNDTVGVSLVNDMGDPVTTLTVDEGDGAEYRLMLDSKPSSNVWIAVSLGSNNPLRVSKSGGTPGENVQLSFSPSNWNAPQTITVTAREDDNTDGGTINIGHQTTSLDDTYEDIPRFELAVTLNDDDPVVSIAAPTTTVTDGSTAQFTLTRTGGDMSEHRTVQVLVTETGGHSYLSSPPTSVFFDENSSTATLNVPIADNKVIGEDGTVKVTVQASPSGAAYYGRDSDPEEASVNVGDGDSETDAEWSLTANPNEITEGSSTGALLTASITNGYTFDDDKTVNLFYITSNLIGDDDYRLFDGTNELTGSNKVFTVAAGQSSDQLTIRRTDDVFYTGDFTFSLRVDLSPTITGTGLASVDLTVREDEPTPRFSVSASATTITEGDTFTLTVSLDPLNTSPTSVTVTMSDPNGVVTTPFTSQTVNLAGAQASRTLSTTFSTDNNLVDEEDGKVTFTLSNPGSPALLHGTNYKVTVTVRDNDVKPGAPTGLTSEAKATGFDLAWTTGDAGSSAITKYQYRVSADTGTTWSPDWTDITGSGATTTTYTLTLDTTKGYLVEIRAVNAVGAGAAAQVGAGAYSQLTPGTHIPRIGFAAARGPDRPWPVLFHYLGFEEPSGVRYKTNVHSYTSDGAACVELLGPSWECWQGQSGSAGHGFTRFEVHERTRLQDQPWSGWKVVNGVEDRMVVWLVDGPARFGLRFVKSVGIKVDQPSTCQAREWRVRALYEDRVPIAHSEWSMATSDRTVDGTAPGRPQFDRGNSSLRRSGSSYVLNFTWSDPAVECHPTTGYEVQHRQLIGIDNTPQRPLDDGDYFTRAGNGAHAGNPNARQFDSATMVQEGNYIYTNWSNVASGSSRSYQHSYTGSPNDHWFRVRAINDNGAGRWTTPVRFVRNHGTATGVVIQSR